MTTKDFVALISDAPLIASVQASEGSPTADPNVLLALAKASLDQGVKALRVEGLGAIDLFRKSLSVPLIGLIKRPSSVGEAYITPTIQDAKDLVNAGCEVVAVDAAAQTRPAGENLAQIISAIHQGGALALADCDSVDSARLALAAGADLVGTTLSGYTQATAVSPTAGPAIELVREMAKLGAPVIAEGRYRERNQVEAALHAGAVAVVVGGALNDPVKQTKALYPRFLANPPRSRRQIGAVDIGGTWLRFATFTPDWQLIDIQKEPNPHDKKLCIEWIRSQVANADIERVGVSTGGVVDPATNTVWKAKEYLMPNHVGISFTEETVGVPCVAWGDGHATAYSHACHPLWAGKSVATIAIGTGVGFGFVRCGEIWAGPRGEYPTLNDAHTSSGATFEALMGGIHLGVGASDDAKNAAIQALREAVATTRGFFFPDNVVIGGSVGLSDWMAPHLVELGCDPSPFGHDAGLYGAAALALFGF